jgi:hypothetical protein
MYDRETVTELNALSKEIFGSSSKWRKMVDKGVPHLIEEDIKKMSLEDGKEVTEMVKTPILYTGPSGEAEFHQYYLKRYSIPEVKEFLLTAKDRQDQVRAMIKRIEEQQRAQAAAKAEAEKASGSSI